MEQNKVKKQICVECGDECDDWDSKDWEEPNLIMGVCFFCRIEIHEENKKKETIKKNQSCKSQKTK